MRMPRGTKALHRGLLPSRSSWPSACLMSRLMGKIGHIEHGCGSKNSKHTHSRLQKGSILGLNQGSPAHECTLSRYLTTRPIELYALYCGRGRDRDALCRCRLNRRGGEEVCMTHLQAPGWHTKTSSAFHVAAVSRAITEPARDC